MVCLLEDFSLRTAFARNDKERVILFTVYLVILHLAKVTRQNRDARHLIGAGHLCFSLLSCFGFNDPGWCLIPSGRQDGSVNVGSTGSQG